jgi:hypothetical protein
MCVQITLTVRNSVWWGGDDWLLTDILYTAMAASMPYPALEDYKKMTSAVAKRYAELCEQRIA